LISILYQATSEVHKLNVKLIHHAILSVRNYKLKLDLCRCPRWKVKPLKRIVFCEGRMGHNNVKLVK